VADDRYWDGVVWRVQAPAAPRSGAADSTSYCEIVVLDSEAVGVINPPAEVDPAGNSARDR
jgi:hypothetical protein